MTRSLLKGLRNEREGIKILSSAIITAPANREKKMAKAGCKKGFILQFHSHRALFTISYLDAWMRVD